ncbi:hypothetical protein [Sphaerisporangium sp. TRM90804]|uniref:hypothetical protein n=1 Tax=Sphaerisporangium sp. TRM90804 TaxID=3031113 RepID=UPI00244BA681|nr:hypothetical protein [Sphaerisporangium sp. TRM90804]MDH2425214.1 hypothetical protein [Sphaerisporangium sp. TRM90804]
MSVLSVTTELTVWCRKGCFIWKEDGFTVTHSAADPVGAARLITRHFRRPADEESPDTREHDSADRPPTDSVR